MSIDFAQLANESRVLLEVDLKPIQGDRFQPTGFPDLGAATYTLNDEKRTQMLLVESAQSMANRLEEVCWDKVKQDLVESLQGLPYVKSTLPDGSITNSVLESHRLNSPYIVNSKEFEEIREKIGYVKDQPFQPHKLARALFHYDVFSLLHGIFLEKVGGVVRLSRSLSAFIEAKDAYIAASGGVKFDRVQPESTGEKSTYGAAKDGYGNVPFQRDEFIAGQITAYFSLDLAQIRGYGLGEAAEQLLIALGLYKIRAFLESDMRLRTACDLTVLAERATRPENFVLPTLDELTAELSELIAKCADQFAGITEVTYVKK